MRMILIFLVNFVIFASAEQFVKIEGSAKNVAQIEIDSTGRWYIVKDTNLYYSLDKGVTLSKIEIPSKNPIYTGIGIDKYNNIYVQDYNLTVFVIAPGLGSSFIIEEIVLAYGKERLVSKPFARFDNDVYFATRSALMILENGQLNCRVQSVPPSSKNFTSLMLYDYGNPNQAGFFYSAGYPRSWVYKKIGFSPSPVYQTRSFVTHMQAGKYYVYFTVNGENSVYVTQSYSIYPTKTIDGIDASNIKNQSDFVIYYPMKQYRAYIYCNIDNTGIVYKVIEKETYKKLKVVIAAQLPNVQIFCGILGDEMYFGTSDGIYKLTEISK